jgi:hypothetical protein
MEYPDSSRPQQRRRIELPLEQAIESVVIVAVGGNHPATTINDLNDDLIGQSLALLGNGHFRYGPLACKLFLNASKKNPHFKKITSGERVTSSMSCARKYFEDEGTGSDQVKFF